MYKVKQEHRGAVIYKNDTEIYNLSKYVEKNLRNNTIMDIIHELLTNITEIGGVCILWIGIHFICANLYPYFCAHISIMGFVLSAFTVHAPHCIALRYAITNGASVITAMWVAIGTWITAKLIFRNRND